MRVQVVKQTEIEVFFDCDAMWLPIGFEDEHRRNIPLDLSKAADGVVAYLLPPTEDRVMVRSAFEQGVVADHLLVLALEHT